jgi:Ca-activated chloride channel family protein
VATAGGGRYARITADGSDLRALGVLDAREGTAAQRPGEGRQWRDEGFWLLPPVMLLALLAFRRRAVLAAVLAVGLLPWMGMQAQAAPAPASPPCRARCGSARPVAAPAPGRRRAGLPRATSPVRAAVRRHRQ